MSTSLLLSKNFTKGVLIMKESELRTRVKAFALHIIAICDEIDTPNKSKSP